MSRSPGRGAPRTRDRGTKAYLNHLAEVRRRAKDSETGARRRVSVTRQKLEGVPRKGETEARRRISVTRQRLEGVPRKVRASACRGGRGRLGGGSGAEAG